MPKPPPGKTTFTDAAELILREKNAALHAIDIIAEARRRNLIQTKGGTPQNTLNSAMYLENKRREQEKRPPRFRKVGPSIWILTKEKGEVK